MRLADLAGRRVAVWGTGREGMAALRAIGAVRPASLVAVEDTDSFRSHAVADVVSGPDGFAALAAADVVVRSPGVPNTHEWVVALRARGVPVTGGSALWMADHAATTVGVTGSKGKSTTSALTSHLFAAVGRPNAFGGNIGVPLLDLPGDADLYVLELSGYQCADLRHSPAIAAVTALFPEHLDWHGGVREYYRDKLNLLAHGPAHIVVNGLDERLMAEVAGLPVTVAGVPDGFHLDGPNVCFRREPLFPRAALNLVGRHNAANLCVALAILSCSGVDVVASAGVLAEAAASFQPLPHRLTHIEDPSGLTFVDDSLSTSPYPAISAMEAFPDRPLTLLVGGQDRGVDYTPLRDYFERRGTATVIGMPDSGARIVDLLSGLPHLTVAVADDLPHAVRLARELSAPGAVVLLSPAAPSYGRFNDFAHRSEVFVAAVRETAG